MNRKNWIGAALVLVAVATAHGDDWPQWLGPQRDGVWRETGILETFPAKGPKLVWQAKIGGGYSGPSVAQGKVVVTDRLLKPGEANPDNPFKKDRVNGVERVLCLKESDGSLLWKHEYPCRYEISYPAGPRCSPVIEGDFVYTVGAMGDLYCLKLASGEVVWSKNFIKDFGATINTWGFAGHPLIDGDRLICLVGGKKAAAVAFDKRTGNVVWKALDVEDPGYCPPTILNIGGVRQLIIWLPDSVNSLDPVSGEIFWTHPNVKSWVKAALTIPTPRLADNHLFLTTFYEGPLMLQLDGTRKPSVAWRGKGTGEMPERTDGIHSIMPTPFIKDGHIYGVCSYGELRCLDFKTGERKWSTHKPITGKSVRWGNAFLTEHEGRFFLFNEQGDLVIAKLSPKGYEEISRAHIIDPDNKMAGKGRLVDWSHPAYANRCIFVRSDSEIRCFSLAKE
jgi:outer membrane protein assembly factor BamB